MKNKQEIKLERINIDRIYHTQNNMPIRDMLLAVVKAQLQADQQVVDKLQAELDNLKTLDESHRKLNGELQVEITSLEAEKKEMIYWLEEGMAGLDLKHPEYYENQEFVVLPLHILQSVKAKYFSSQKEGE